MHLLFLKLKLSGSLKSITVVRGVQVAAGSLLESARFGSAQQDRPSPAYRLLPGHYRGSARMVLSIWKSSIKIVRPMDIKGTPGSASPF
jgi:hypothetical protein